MAAVLSAAFIILFPMCAYFLCRRIKALDALGTVVVCYAAGILIGNSPIELDAKTVKLLGEGSIPFAIVLLLYSTNVLGWLKLAKSTMFSFFLLVVSVIIFSTVGSLFIKPITEDYWKLGGMMAGVYTGGTPNMSAIGLSLGVKEESFVLLNAADVVLGAVYLLVMLSFGPKLLSKFLRPYKRSEVTSSVVAEEKARPARFAHYLISFLVTLIIVGISLGVSHLITGKEDVAIIMLSLTTLALIMSFSRKVREWPGTNKLGDYLLLIFCTSIGSMAKLENLVGASGPILLYCTFIMLGAILFHLILCKIFRIDRDTSIITSVSGIFGPAFIPAMVRALKNPDVMVSGMTTGLIGYAIGNYLGLTLAYFIRSL